MIDLHVEDKCAIAELFTSDLVYAPGTVVILGDDTEVTIARKANDKRVAGVIVADPAYLIHPSKHKGVAVALQGRVYCKVIGRIARGDILVTSDLPGVAMVNNDPKAGTIIGKAISTYDKTETVGFAEILVGRL